MGLDAEADIEETEDVEEDEDVVAEVEAEAEEDAGDELGWVTGMEVDMLPADRAGTAMADEDKEEEEEDKEEEEEKEEEREEKEERAEEDAAFPVLPGGSTSTAANEASLRFMDR